MATSMDVTTAETANSYQEWARVEAHGSSPIYERLALAVAQDPAALALLSEVEPVKRQPNLLFGALRWHDVNVEDPAEALAWLREHQDAALAVLRTRRTQTNEVARCATFLPALALLPQPLALIEVGASAGLCLLYDSWRYHYTGPGVDHWVGPATSPLTLSCSERAWPTTTSSLRTLRCASLAGARKRLNDAHARASRRSGEARSSAMSGRICRPSTVPMAER